MESVFLAVLVLYISGTLVMALGHGVLYIIHKQGYSRQWLYSWMGLFLSYIMMFFGVMLENDLYYYLSGFFVIIGFFFFFKGTMLYLSRPFKDALSLVFISIIALYGVTGLLPLTLGMYQLYTLVLTAVFFGISGYYLCKSSEVVNRIIGLFVLVLAFLNLIYPLAVLNEVVLYTVFAFLSFIGSIVGIGTLYLHIHKRQLLAVEERTQLYYLSYHDGLTSLFNRNYMDQIIEDYEKQCPEPFSVIVGDLNNLKEINDTYGHSYGDELIQKTAALFKEHVNKRAIVGRYGGDEFLVLLPKTSKYSVQSIVKMVSSRAKYIKVRDVELSIAVGYATKTSSDKSLNDVIKRAEQAMYDKKRK